MQIYEFTIIICVYYIFVDTQISGRTRKYLLMVVISGKGDWWLGGKGVRDCYFLSPFFLVSCLFLLSNLNIFYNKYTGLNVNKTKYNHTDTEALLDYCSVSNMKAGLLLAFSRLYISPFLRTVSAHSRCSIKICD